MLAGRTSEQARLHRLLEGAAAGQGAALVLQGLPGAGKSALLDDLVETCSHLDPPAHVVRTSGIESESPLAFAALQRLLRPAMSLIDRLPERQASALRTAFGETDGTSDRFVVFLASLNLLAELAAEHPLLVVVDDAHWLDDASAAAVQFIARRLEAERIAMVIAARVGDSRTFDAGDLTVVEVGGLDLPDVVSLLSDRAGAAVAPHVAATLHERTAGNPLALVEMCEALPRECLTGLEPLPAELPLTEGVEAAFLSRYRGLPPGAQTWLLVAAADDSARESVVSAAASDLGADDEAADVVERTGLARVRNGRVQLRHPLVRSSVYGAATSAERRRAHRALASALAGDEDRRAWHLAAATDHPDDEVVGELVGVAERAAGRGGHEAAAAAWTRAAELTVSGDQRGFRLLEAASSAWLAAHPAHATSLAAVAAAEPLPPRDRVRLLTLQGQIAWNTRSLDEGYDLVLQAAELARDVDPAMASRLAMLAASLAGFGARSPRGYDAAAHVTDPDDAAPAEEHLAHHLLRGFHALARPDYVAASQHIQRAFELADEAGIAADHMLQPNLAIAAWLIDADLRNLALHEQQLTAARASGALPMIEHALTRGFNAHLVLGSWSKAASAATEALSLTSGIGHPSLTVLPLAELAMVSALRGQPEADDLLDQVAAILGTVSIGITETLVMALTHWARGLRAHDQPEVALHHFGQIRLPAYRRAATLDVVDAAVREGRPDAARPWLDEIAEFAGDTGSPAAVAVLEHARALVAPIDEPEEHFRRALAAHEASPRVPDRARTHLAFGEHLRRARRRVDARGQLRSALTLFEDLGAAPLAERAAQELRASGETARRREVGDADELTAQERQVTGLVRQGLSNRDVAAQLFVSPRTVDFHLRNVFRKLGVSSRAELIALPLDL